MNLCGENLQVKTSDNLKFTHVFVHYMNEHEHYMLSKYIEHTKTYVKQCLKKILVCNFWNLDVTF